MVMLLSIFAVTATATDSFTCDGYTYTLDDEGNATIHYNHDHSEATLTEVITPAGCTTEGTALYTCICTYEKKRAIPATGHSDTDDDFICDGCTEKLPGYSEPNTDLTGKSKLELLFELIKLIIEFIFSII